MTPTEADILRFLEHRGGMATDTALARQFGQAHGIALRSLLRHLAIEVDRHHIRITPVGEDALGRHDDGAKYVPFEGHPGWVR